MENKKDRIFTKAFITIMLSSALISLCNYFFYSTMPLYAAQLGGPPAFVGFVTGIYTLSCFITRTFAGSICDKYGRYSIMILGVGLCILGCFGYLFAFNILILLFMRVVHGVGFGTHTTASGTVAIDVLPKSRRMEGLGYFSLYSTIASAIGPGIALTICEKEELGYKALFLLSGTIMVITLLLDISVRKAVKEAEPPTKKEETEKAKTFLGFEAKALAPTSIMMLLCFAQSSVISFLAVYAIEENMGNIGIFFTISSVAIFLSRFFVGRIGDRFGIKYVLIPSILLSSASLFIIALFPVKWVIFCVAVPYGLGFGAAGPVINTMVVTLCDDSHLSSATSMYYASLDVGLGLGSSVLGALVALIGCKNMIIFSGFIALSAILVYFFFISKNKALDKPVKRRVNPHDSQSYD